MIAIRLRAKNDTNGNPRRCYVVFDNQGNKIGACDEGYRGSDSLFTRYPELKTQNIEDFDVTPGEYRRQLSFSKG